MMNPRMDEAPRVNLYDRMFERLRETGLDANSATAAVVEAYLDGKPTTSGKNRCSRYERDSAFWISEFVTHLPLGAWPADDFTLALSRYFGQECVANPALLERIAATYPQTIERAVRWSGLVLQQSSPRRSELDQVARAHPNIAELCRVLDIFDQAYRSRLATVEHWRHGLTELTPFELLIYASLYAFEQMVPRSLAHLSIPQETLEDTQAHWQAINDLLLWKLSTASSTMLRLREQELGRSLQTHLSPYLFPSPQGSRPRHDLRAIFADAVAAQVELNDFESRSADAFSFDDAIAFVRKDEVLEIVEQDPCAREAWQHGNSKLTRLHNYWFYRAIDEFIRLGLAELTIGRPENHEANRLAYVKALRTQLRLTEVYGIDETLSTETGQRVGIFQVLLASELMSSFYQQDFLQTFVDHAASLGHWAAALRRLALEGLATGMQNRFPLTWSDRKAKINQIVGWTVCGDFPRGSHAMAAAVLDFLTSDWVALAERLRTGKPGLYPQLFERPVIKFGQHLIALPWVFGLQNNSTAAINNLRRLGARREEAWRETRRIEERLGALFESRGFVVALNWIPADPQAGEVDLICRLDQTVLVLELKSTFIRQSQRDAWVHRTTTLHKAGRQVKKKVVAVQLALASGDTLGRVLGLPAANEELTIHGWILDTSIECDHDRFSGFLKVSLEEVLIALRDDRHLLNDPGGIFSGRFLEPHFVLPEQTPEQTRLYPAGFSVGAFIRTIENALVWDDAGLH